jgi:hypothetical protein
MRHIINSINKSEVRGFGYTSKAQSITYRNLDLRLVPG